MVLVRRLARADERQGGFAHVLAFLLIIIVLLVVGAAGLMVLKKSKAGGGSEGIHSPASDAAAKMPDCKGKEVMSQSPVKPEQIRKIIPLGNLAPPGHVLPTYHQYYNYLHATEGPNSYSVKTTLYVPADMTVTQMMKMDNADLTPSYDAYRIDFAICKQVTGYFILVQTLSDKLAAAMQPPYDRTQNSDVGKGKISHNWYKDVNVELKAGEILGWAGGKMGDPDGLDIAIIDTRAPKPALANPARWQSSEIYYVCTLDYFPAALSKQLYAKLGDYYGNGVAAGSNPCGSIYQDVPGTAQGVWLTEDSEGLWAVRGLAALVHSNFDESRGVFSLGTKAADIGLSSSNINFFTPAKSGNVNLDFNLVKPGDTIYCYEVSQNSGGKNTILLRLASDRLTLGPGASATCGTGPWTFGKTIDYVR